MGAIKAYLISAAAAAVLCGILTSLTAGKGAIPSVIKLLAGILLTVAVLQPVLQVRLSKIDIYIDTIQQEAQYAADQGADSARQEMEAVIKSRVQAYILDKATELGGSLDVDVTLEDMVPAQVTLSGYIAPYAKTQLSTWIQANCGILKEAQRWTG